MSRRYLLFPDHNRVTVYARSCGQLLPEASFDDTSGGLEQFSIYLSEHRHDTWLLVADTPDESCIRENIPQLRGADRKALIERRIRQHFPEPALTRCLSLGSNTGGEKHESLLISALSQADKLNPWLDVLNANSSRCDGIYTLAQLGPTLLKALGQPASNGLLLVQYGNTLRENYLLDGQLVFTRQTQLPETTASEIAIHLQLEILRLEQHLLGQRAIARDEILPAYILAQSTVIAAVLDIPHTSNNFNIQPIEISDAAQRIGCSLNSQTGDATPIFLHLLTNAKPKHKFHEPRLSRASLVRHAAQSIQATTFVLVCAALLHLAYQLNEADILNDQVSTLSVMQPLPADEWSALSDAERQARINLDHQHQAIISQKAGPESALQRIGQALESNPEIELDHVDWLNEINRQTTGSEESISLSGRIKLPETSSAREVIASQNRLVASLRVAGNAAVDITKAAISLDSSSTDANREEKSSSGKSFSLRIRSQRKT